jgi:ABC-type nitrate/sulfonate/bicarbonate transport system substrate-binding protein
MRQVRFPQQILPFLAVPVWLLAAGCSGDSPPRDEASGSLERITLKFDGPHGTRFLGFYVAREMGYYAEEGLEVAVEDSSEASELETIPIRSVAGEFDFAVGSEALVQAQEAGLPVVILAGIHQHGPQVLFARAGAGIAAPADLAGKRVVMKGAPWRSWIEEFLAREGLALEDIDEVPGGDDMTPFFRGEVDVWAGSLSSEVPAVREKGIDVVTFPLHEYGIPLVGNSLYTRRDHVVSRPELVEQFVRASLRGWRWAVEHPEEAVDEMLSSYPELVDRRKYWQLSFESAIPLIISPGVPVGDPGCGSWGEYLQPKGAVAGSDLCDNSFFLRAVMTDGGKGER